MVPSWFSKKSAPAAVKSAPVPEPPASEPEQKGFPEPLAGVGNIDRFDRSRVEFKFDEQELLKRTEARVEEGKYELPHIPSTHMTLLDLIADPESDVDKVETLVSADMVLTASMLKVANSVMYGGTRQVDNVRGAILRIGMRGLRSMLYSQSVKSVIFRGRGLTQIAEEIWRQACSVAATSRSLASSLGMDPEQTYTLGLLHDIGKIPLLSILRKEAPSSFQFRTPFVGAVLDRYHEQVGEKLTSRWNLPQEIVAVSACHHEYAQNLAFTRGAALVNLAHRQDLYLSCGDETRYVALANDQTLDILNLAANRRQPLLESIRDGYSANRIEGLFG
ncbi:MAG: HDOD domain-containing protein [Planctomycetota bacterium]